MDSGKCHCLTEMGVFPVPMLPVLICHRVQWSQYIYFRIMSKLFQYCYLSRFAAPNCSHNPFGFSLSKFFIASVAVKICTHTPHTHMVR